MKVKNAIDRLNKILPIKTRLDALDKPVADVYLQIVNSFYDRGRAPSIEELTASNADAAGIIKQLAESDMITLAEDGSVKGCYPFTMEPREHRIQINGSEVHAMCALDALAPSAMFHSPSVVLSECAVSKKPVKVELDDQTVINLDEVRDLHFGINWAAASSCCSCSDSLCTEMLFLKDTEIAEGWMREDPANREIFDMTQAMEFSAGFFKPMMQQG